MSEKYALPLFILLVVGTGALIGFLFQPGPWYAGLSKPWFNPPGAVFAPVWTLLYILIGIAGWRSWYRTGDRRMKFFWLAQMGLNFLWSPAFFGAESLVLALAIILPMWICIAAFLLRALQIDRISAWLFLPYLAWVSFATLLNAALYLLN
ncbi:TspO/MBR family protein [Pseudogemmobacter faecipullorum]|uniref:Tryptophan-rich sensory protein n=1 Tax=Pseudogemmobacter faecipullorum TaxID=2755041 RepID=A0ABS8CMH4_9RHOB|nr:TspO/MBR family protein [Pseudogemmobacter faecipullorum]MCB5410588.1 tryptophan-rich sensory protein [Pseudogemmobacter faecipullorum]